MDDEASVSPSVDISITNKGKYQNDDERRRAATERARSYRLQKKLFSLANTYSNVLKTRLNLNSNSHAENALTEANNGERESDELYSRQTEHEVALDKRNEQIIHLDQTTVKDRGKMDLPQDSNPRYEKGAKPADGSNKNCPSQLDRFKRRLIRAVAVMMKQNMPEVEMWAELKKEIGCDCRMLWRHMRALTLKKLRRLLPANDYLLKITKIARFTATDWLLFDLVLVHENINVINIKENPEDGQNEASCLHELFELVKQHHVECLSGDELTEAWIRVTVQYNGRGRQVSPMMLQRRWHQLKEVARANFYNFWYKFRGNTRMLDQAMRTKPTELQTEIVTEYKRVITESYPSWETLIEEKRVILAEEFAQNREAKRKVGGKSLNGAENDTEIELIEPQVETIDLEVDSDTEIIPNTQDEDNDTAENVYNIELQTNSEYQEHVTYIANKTDDDTLELDGLSDVETMHIPMEEKTLTERTVSHCESESPELTDIDIDTNILPKITNVVGNIAVQDENNIEDEVDEILKQKVNNLKNMEIPEVMTDDTINKVKESRYPPCDTSDIVHEEGNNMNIKITQIKTEFGIGKEINTLGSTNEKYTDVSQVQPKPGAFVDNATIQCDSDDEIDTLLKEKAREFMMDRFKITNIGNVVLDNVENAENIKRHEVNEIKVEQKDMHGKEKEFKTVDIFSDGCDEVNFDDEGIVFEDDGIAFEEINDNKNSNIEEKTDSISDTEKPDNVPKIDLKLLMHPKVYTKKLDHMDVFKFIDFNKINDKKLIERVILESKPVDIRALEVEDLEKFRKQAIREYEIDGTESDEDIIQSSSTEEVDIKVKRNSWLLQKPKNCSYNPIQLCKNPDFNTRLKRLTTGFLSQIRNREYLKECKPLTIDLHKAFESKLVDGTIYLKKDDIDYFKSPTAAEINNHQISVAVHEPSQISKLHVTNNDFNEALSEKDNVPLSFSSQKCNNERSKVINLPDIDQVRRVNQSLLTAEVTPIRIENVNTTSKEFVTTCKEPDKENNDKAEHSFIKPITVPSILESTVASLISVKKEPVEIDLNEKTVATEPNDTNYQISSTTKELMAHKINDQIMNIRNQITEVETNTPDVAVANAGIHKNPDTLPLKKTWGYQAKTFNDPKEQTIINTSINTPMSREETWKVKYYEKYFPDTLLTLDTLNKMLFLFKGNEEAYKFCYIKKKKCKVLSNHPYKKLLESIEGRKSNEIGVDLVTESNKTLNAEVKKNKPKSAASKKNTKPPKNKTHTRPIYCCWAREKMISINNKLFKVGDHKCRQVCYCCCREKLLEMSPWKRVNNKAIKCGKKDSTIVLSDEETMNTDSHKSDNISSNPSETITNKPVKINLRQGSVKTNLNNKQINSVHTSQIEIDKSEIRTYSPSSVQPPPLLSLKPIDKISTVQSSTVCEVPQLPKGNSLNLNTEGTIKQSSATDKNSANLPTFISNTKTKQYRGRKSTYRTVVHAGEGQTCNKTLVLNNSKEKDPQATTSKEYHQILLKSDQFKTNTRNPICLGKNQILLCSLAKPIPTLVAPEMPVLPNGVRLMLLPNGEVTLSIDPGIQLDPELLNTLPTIMGFVQENVQKNNGIIPNINIQKENDKDIQQNESTINSAQNSDKQQIIDLSSGENSTIVNETTTQVVNASDTQTVDQSCGSGNPTDISSSEACNVSDDKINQAEVTGSLNIKEGKESFTDNTERTNLITVVDNENTDVQIEKNTTSEQLNDKIQISIIPNGDSSLNSPKVDDNSSNDANKNSVRTTILSDLMEMSGISAEDTKVVPDVRPRTIPLPPSIIPIPQLSTSHLPKEPQNVINKVPDNISVAGLYSNLFTFEPNCPRNNLLNYIATIRPDLNAVTTFLELKYVHENNGQFYKLDVETGSIVPINVFFKKNLKAQAFQQPQEFIDLTDDSADNEMTEPKNNETLSSNLTYNISKDSAPHVKPIKLFKSVHPDELKHQVSIIKNNRTVYLKKVYEMNKEHRRKQILQNRDEKYFQKNNKVQNLIKKPVSHDQNYLNNVPDSDSSDEEPLAKKSKRMKVDTNKIDENKPEQGDAPKCDTDGVRVLADSDILSDTSDVEVNSMDIEGVNPELHPVAFEEGSESDDDLCILGV